MIRRETCTLCKGGRWVAVKTPVGRDKWAKCPECGGQGYKIRVTK